MRSFLACFFTLLISASFSAGQTPPSSQTARQALIEMFFGTAPNHLEKHLPDSTRKVLKRINEPNGMNALDQFSMFANMAKAGGAKLETFDTGPTLLRAEDPRDGSKVEIAVEGDNLSGDEDDIEVSLHVTKEGTEQKLPFIPRFTFAMKTEAEVWRLNEISVTVRVPLADPDFLKNIEDRQNQQNEEGAKSSLQSIVIAENGYHSAHGVYACSLADLSKNNRSNGERSVTINVLSSDLAAGKRGGYIFAISGCDGSQYKVVGEPEIPNSGQRAFCIDESGGMKSSSDGKATTCLNNGETIQSKPATGLVAYSAEVPSAPAADTGDARSKPVRVRVSQAVTQAMVSTRVPPVYPRDAKIARIQGSVVMSVVIDRNGNVQSLKVISGHPMLAQAAIDAVKHWKYRPYLLNGDPVEVDTQVTVNFTLSMPGANQ
ncbi:MAG TPA: energy transducer TonB [Terriglobales bacterium]|jgi:TonB family protein